MRVHITYCMNHATQTEEQAIYLFINHFYPHSVDGTGLAGAIFGPNPTRLHTACRGLADTLVVLQGQRP